jgi:hypothetical protein
MVFLIDDRERKDCSLEVIKMYEKDINYLIVYKYMLSYFGLVSLKDDIIKYNTYKKSFILRHNGSNYHCKKEDDGFKTTMLKKYIMRDIKIKNIIDDIS